MAFRLINNFDLIRGEKRRLFIAGRLKKRRIIGFASSNRVENKKGKSSVYRCRTTRQSLVFCWFMASKSDYRVILGAAIRRKRKHSRLSQAVLAKKAGLHPNYFGRVERGEETVLLVSLRRIAKALGGCVSELVKDI